MPKDWVAILDFGSQYTHLIARRIRECGVYSQIVPYNSRARKLLSDRPQAIILSGGPASVTEKFSPACHKNIFNMDIPILGICYGAQLMARTLGGKVMRAKAREYGKTTLRIKSAKNLFKNLSGKNHARTPGKPSNCYRKLPFHKMPIGCLLAVPRFIIRY